MSNSYWADRAAKAQATLTEKSIEATEKQLIKYYQHSMKKIIGQFEEVYNKVFLSMVESKAPTPADLYKLDKYWVLQNQLKEELQKLGDKQAALLSKQFTTQWQQIYDALAIPDATGHFNKADIQVAQQMINQIWCADGKSWSSRIWDNTDKLQQALNDNLIECVVNGRKTTELKNILQEQFNVCYSRADSLVRTEMAHIQTQAAQQRYVDYGVQEVEVWADKDERRCDVCGKLHKKKYPVNAVMPIPAHPRCRCCVIPVIESVKPVEKEKEENDEIINKFNQKVEIDKALQNDNWKDVIQIMKKLSDEYDTRLTSIKPNADKLAGSANMGGMVRLNSRKKDVAIHEFAHTINMERLAKYKVEETNEFWKEIKAIKRRYKKDVADDSSRWISSYANTNIDEFMAEAFTHAKLKELGLEIPFQYGTDFTYSDEVLAVIDKYFKKKKKK